MTASETLEELARQVRRDTIRLLEATPADWLTRAPEGTSNHILWHAGHAVWLQDLLCEKLLGAGDSLPEDWSDTFGMNCRPPSQTLNWPTRGEMEDQLHTQLERVIDLLGDASDADLQQVADSSRGDATIADRIIHGFHDEAKHCGEIYLLLKLFRAERESSA